MDSLLLTKLIIQPENTTSANVIHLNTGKITDAFNFHNKEYAELTTTLHKDMITTLLDTTKTTTTCIELNENTNQNNLLHIKELLDIHTDRTNTLINAVDLIIIKADNLFNLTTIEKKHNYELQKQINKGLINTQNQAQNNFEVIVSKLNSSNIITATAAITILATGLGLYLNYKYNVELNQKTLEVFIEKTVNNVLKLHTSVMNDANEKTVIVAITSAAATLLFTLLGKILMKKF